MKDRIEEALGITPVENRTLVIQWFDNSISNDDFSVFTPPAAVIDSVVEILDIPRKKLIMSAKSDNTLDTTQPLREVAAEMAVRKMFAKFADQGYKKESVVGHASSTREAIRALF